MTSTNKTGIKPYNPFLRDPDLKDLELSVVKKSSKLFSKDGKNLSNIEAGEIYCDKVPTYRQLINIYSGLNFFYPVVVVINKAWDKDFLEALNRFYFNVDRSTLRCYTLYYPYSYKKEFIDKKNKKRYKIVNDALMNFKIFTRLKRSGNKPIRNFFSLGEEVRINSDLIHRLKNEVQKTEKSCVSLLLAHQASQESIKMFTSCIFRSVYDNLNEIMNLVNKVKKEKQINLDFDLETLVRRHCNMVYSGLKFLFKVKSLSLPKNKQKKPFTRKEKPRKAMKNVKDKS